MMTNATLIVPGLHGSGEGHWQDWWLEDDRRAVLVRQDDWSNPQADQWLAALEAAIIRHPGATIAAHSLGAVLTARLARSPVAPLVAVALLVAPADIERTGVLNGRTYEFGSMPGDQLPFPSIVVASQNDPYMPVDKARDLAEVWGSEFHNLGDAGHINIESGFGRWPEAYSLAASIVGTQSPVLGVSR